MNKQAALVKLAQVRLAINYVLRSRGLEKRAVIDRYSEDTYNQPVDYQREFENERIRNSQFSYGADPEAMLPEERQEILNAIDDDREPYWENKDYYKPEFDYINRIPSNLEFGLYGRFPNNVRNMPFTYDETAEDMVGSYAFDDPTTAFIGIPHRASLPKWHPSHVTSEDLNKGLAHYYTYYYNGNRPPRTFSYEKQFEDGTADSDTLVDLGLPMYPVEGIKYPDWSALMRSKSTKKLNNSINAFWNSAVKRQMPWMTGKTK